MSIVGNTLAALALVSLPVHAAAQASTWRFTSGAWAPWVVSPGEALSNAALYGRTIEFAPGRVIGPAALGCARAVYEFVVMPAEGLFQGGLPAPAEGAAIALGVSRLPVMTLAVRCDTGVFDYHFVSADRLLTALDDVVWTLTAESSPSGPDAVVQALLIEHMTHDMGFTPESVERKRHFLSAELATLIAAYFERPLPADEPPPINGDPFTDSQEYPDRFTINSSETAAASARVRVTFRDGPRDRSIDALLRLVAETWLVDDVQYEDGTTLRELLGAGRALETSVAAREIHRLERSPVMPATRSGALRADRSALRGTLVALFRSGQRPPTVQAPRRR